MRRCGSALVLLIAVTASLASAGTRASRPLLPSPRWKLAFVRDGDIWLARGDGSGAHRIIKNAEAPAWSPDRTHLAFERDGDVWVAKADGTGRRQVTTKWRTRTREEREAAKEMAISFGRDVIISWDPRRDYLFFSHDELFYLTRADDKERTPVLGYSIYETPVHPTERDRLIRQWDMADDRAGYYFSDTSAPAWAEDGEHLAFVRNGDIWLATRRDQGADLPEDARWGYEVIRLAAVATYDAATSRASRETDSPTRLSWSPDGRWIAYDYHRHGGSGIESTYLLEVHTGKRHRLTDTCTDPCFSPDGRWVACGGGYGYTTPGIHAITTDGKVDRVLVKDGTQPAW